MTSTLTRRSVKIGAASAVAGLALISTAGPALAATAISDPNSQGGVIIEDQGVRVTTGDLQRTPFADQDIATSAATLNGASYSKATLYYATPVDNTAPAAFPNSKVSASTNYNPTTQFPTVSASGNSLASYICSKPNTNPATSPYANEYELRVAPSGAGVNVAPTTYIWTATLLVTIVSGACNGTDASSLVGTWTQLDAPLPTAPTGPAQATAALPEAPYAVLLPLIAGTVGAGAWSLRRRKATV